MKLRVYSYRYAQEVIQHPNYASAWAEIESVLKATPIFVYPGKSAKNRKLDIVQQLMNSYLERVLCVEKDWQYQPLATRIKQSGLKADFRKVFGDLPIQAEVQFGNMSRWYSDIFKFQTAYSQSLIKMGLSVIPTAAMACRIDSNVVQYERAVRELPSAELSITLPLLMIGLEPDDEIPVIDVSKCAFSSIKEIIGKGKKENRYRIVNAYMEGREMSSVCTTSPVGPTPVPTDNAD